MMANLVPKISVDEIENKPERDVARMLVDQPPSQVTIFHSYPWLRLIATTAPAKSR